MTRIVAIGAAMPLAGDKEVELQVLTSGAFKAALQAVAPRIEAATGHRLAIAHATAGGVAAKVRAGEVLDLVILPPAHAAGLGALIGPATPLAKVGIGVAVLDGAPRPEVATEAAVRTAVLAARAPAWVDPAAGGSSGIYMAGLWDRWGIAAALAPRAVLVNRGLVTDKLRSGEADLAFQQISELLQPGIALIGPLPASIQSYTVYAGAIPANTAKAEAARSVLAHLATAEAAAALKTHGLDAPGN